MPLTLLEPWFWYYHPSQDSLIKVALTEEYNSPASPDSTGVVTVVTFLGEVLRVPRCALQATEMEALTSCISLARKNLDFFGGLGARGSEILMRIDVHKNDLVRRLNVQGNGED